MDLKFKGTDVKKLNLPTLYSRPEFPNDRSHTPLANICYQFDHLKNVACKLLPLQNVEVRLLLNYDASYVNQPQEVISSKIVRLLRHLNPSRLVCDWINWTHWQCKAHFLQQNFMQ